MSLDAAPVCLRAEDAIELGELLEFLGSWLDRDAGHLARSFTRFVSNAGYTVEDLRADLARFAVLLGGDGERFVFGDDR